MSKSFSIHIERSPIRISRAGALSALRSGAGPHAHRCTPRGGDRNEMIDYLAELEDARELELELFYEDVALLGEFDE